MANRKKRLATEQALLERITLERNALKQEKKKRNIRRKLTAAQTHTKEILGDGDYIPKVWQPFIEKGLRLAAIRRQLPEILNIFKGNHCKLVRPLEEWTPASKSSRDNPAKDLLRHAFVRYEMPDFLVRNMLDWPDTQLGVSVDKVFFHIAAGNSLRHLTSLPQQLSKKESHWFLHAPEHLNWEQALAWARAYNVCGDSEKSSFLGDLCLRFFSANTPLWRAFLVFVSNNPELDLKFLAETAEFIHHQWGRPYFVKVAGWVNLELQPLFPNLDLNSLSLNGLKRRMAEQAQDLEFWKKHYHTKSFKKGPLDNCEIQIRDKTYQICQLTTLEELHRESRTMKHCVRGYHYECNNGSSFIYKMTRFDEDGSEAVGTIEIQFITEEGGKTHYRLNQFKARYNERPIQEGFDVLKNWIKQGGVELKWDGKEY